MAFNYWLTRFPKAVKLHFASASRNPSTSSFAIDFAMTSRELRAIQRELKKAREEANRLASLESKLLKQVRKSQELKEAKKEIVLLQSLNKRLKGELEKKAKSASFWRKQSDAYKLLLNTVASPEPGNQRRSSSNRESFSRQKHSVDQCESPVVFLPLKLLVLHSFALETACPVFFALETACPFLSAALSLLLFLSLSLSLSLSSCFFPSLSLSISSCFFLSLSLLFRDRDEHKRRRHKR